MYALLTSFVTLMGAALLLLATDGARAFTSEGARRLDIERSPRPIPNAHLEDSRGLEIPSDSLHGSPLLVGFIYTQCASVCPELTKEFRSIRERLDDIPAAREVQLLSVSFDPDRDTPERLAEYSRHFGADPERWRFVRVRDTDELSHWLATFGIVVIPDGRGGFEHNAALHIVDRSGRLGSVRDLDDIDGAIADLLEQLERAGPAS